MFLLQSGKPSQPAAWFPLFEYLLSIINMASRFMKSVMLLRELMIRRYKYEVWPMKRKRMYM